MTDGVNLFDLLTDEDKTILGSGSRFRMFLDSVDEDRRLTSYVLAFPLTPEDGIGAMFFCYSNWREFVKR